MKSILKIVWKTKITFFWSKTLLFLSWTRVYFILGDIFFKIRKNLITSAFFYLLRQILKNRYASVKAANAALVKLTKLIIKNDHVINCAMFFCKWFKYDQTSNVIWLSTTRLLIFLLEMSSKKPLFTTKLARIWIEISCYKNITFYSYKILYIYIYFPGCCTPQGKWCLLMHQKP